MELHKMELHKVESSTIDAIGYEPLALAVHGRKQGVIGTLHVRFLDGGEYEYYDVPMPTYYELLVSPSKGSALARLVKSAGYQYRKVRGKRRA